MSVLIDKLLKDIDESITSQSNDKKWYIAKPLPFYSIKTKLKRINDGIRVMRGKSFAVHYKEDEK
jgi:hypothetical protein